MPKRGTDGRFKTSGGSLTGGTGDVKPQILTIAVPAASGTDDYSSIEFAVPRIVMGSRDSATIMEVLKCWFYIGINDTLDTNHTVCGALSTTFLRAQDEICTIANMAANPVISTVFAYVLRDVSIVTSGADSNADPMVVDLTDGNGNGILIATDNIFFTAGLFNNTATSSSTVKILYRMVNVGITEYVGIVQSQIV